jgi:uncharacterized cupin superfamily protein
MKLPALDPATVKEVRGSAYPEPFKSRMGERMKKRLGEACGLTRTSSSTSWKARSRSLPRGKSRS